MQHDEVGMAFHQSYLSLYAFQYEGLKKVFLFINSHLLNFQLALVSLHKVNLYGAPLLGYMVCDQSWLLFIQSEVSKISSINLKFML